MTPFTPEQITEYLQDVSAWAQHGQTIRRTYQFETFLASIAFVRRVAKRAEKFQHCPDIDIRYDKVTLFLTTHDAGGLTAKDFNLAEECDKIFAKFVEA